MVAISKGCGKAGLGQNREIVNLLSEINNLTGVKSKGIETQEKYGNFNQGAKIDFDSAKIVQRELGKLGTKVDAFA